MRGAALGMLLCLAGIAASSAKAQDLGEIARQERAKKQNQDQTPPATHVYTNDDLPKHQILTPEDKSRFEAARTADKSKPDTNAAANSQKSLPKTDQPKFSGAKALTAGIIVAAIRVPSPVAAPALVSTSASVKAAQVVAPAVPLDQMPLGDVARYYRAQKQQQARATAGTVATAAPAPIPVSASASASTAPSPTKTAQPVAAAAPTAVPLNQLPLGDVARYYRAQKQMQAEANAKAAPQKPATVSFPMTSSFPMTISAAPLAMIKNKPNGEIKLAPKPVTIKPVTRDPEPAALVRHPGMRDPFAPPPHLREQLIRPMQTRERFAQHAPVRENSPRPAQIAPEAVALAPPAAASSADKIVLPISRIAPRLVAPPVAALATSHKIVPPAAAKAVAPVARPIAVKFSAPKAPSAKPVVAKAVPGRPFGANLPVSVRIASGDTLWALARKFLGSGTRWQELISLNPDIQDPHQLRTGMQIVLRSPAD
jgi:hypothetical protein